MQYKKKIIQNRLEATPLDKQVWIYGAEIIIEFLNQNFVPTKYFLSTEGRISAREEKIKPRFFASVLCYKQNRMKVSDLYEKYLLFRETRDYTSEIETKYKFSIIINKLSYSKNNWEFKRTRFGREQVTMYGPLLSRSEASKEIRKAFPVHNVGLTGNEVEMIGNPLSEEEDDALVKVFKTIQKGYSVGVDLAKGEDTQVELNWIEVKEWIEVTEANEEKEWFEA